jgi:quinol monooxygenase YgiN
MIIVTGAVRTTSDSKGPILAVSLEYSRRSRTEPGCVAFNIHVDCEDTDRLVFFEIWEDTAAVKAHLGGEKAREFAAYLQANAAVPPEIAVYTAQAAPV